MGRAARPAFAHAPVAALAAAAFVLLVAFADGYGYHRDELYFVEAGKHPAFGYDDQPPLTPLLGRASAAVFGQTPTGLRMVSALALAAVVALAALTARELGGGRRAQVLASASVAASSMLFAGHILSTTTFDLLAWAALGWIGARLLGGADRREWLAFGAVAGIGLENKWLVALMLVGLGTGLAAARRWELLRGPWPALAALIALALWAPNLIWQADHGWPQRELSSQIADEDPLGTRLLFLPMQLLIVSPLLAPVWIAGLVWLLRSERAAAFRALGFGYVALVAICLVVGGKFYYPWGWYPALLAAGGVALEGWLAPRARRLAAGAVVALAAAASLVVALPSVPERSLADTPIPDLNEDLLHTVAWPEFMDQVAAAWRSIPPRERERAVILTGNYGEAGAIRRFGPERGLPTAYSGHNSFWSFGRPRGRAGPVLAVGFPAAYLRRFFRGCRQVGTIDNGMDLDTEEQGARLEVCRAPRRPWAELWPELHHLDA